MNQIAYLHEPIVSKDKDIHPLEENALWAHRALKNDFLKTARISSNGEGAKVTYLSAIQNRHVYDYIQI